MSTDEPSWPDAQDGGDAAPTPPPPPPPPAAPTGGGLPTGAATATGASLGVRFAARLLDGIILIVVGLAISVVVPGDSLVVSNIIGAAVSLGYYGWFESNRGATPGKQVLNLRVLGASGAMPTMEESVKRNVWLAFQIVPFLGGVAALVAVIAIAVTISTDDRNRGLHDQFGGTTVVRD